MVNLRNSIYKKAPRSENQPNVIDTICKTHNISKEQITPTTQ